jgi:diguanylate cyclase (GGDEF)-like protein
LNRPDDDAGVDGAKDRTLAAVTEERGALAGAPLERWMVPFIAVAVAAQVSAAVLPDLRSVELFGVSCAVLAAMVVLAFLLPWRKLPVGAQLLVPLGYLASLLLLMISQTSAASGMRALVLLPIMWVALYHRRWEGVLVTACAIGVLTAVAAIDGEAADIVARRAVLWGAMGALIVLSVQNLRRWLGAAIGERDDALREAEILTTAAAELNATLNPRQVVALATRLAALTASPPGAQARRASYLRIDGDSVQVAGSFDETGLGGGYTWLTSDHPQLNEVIRTGSPTRGPLEPDEVGPSLVPVIEATGIRHCACVPIHARGALDGVLVLASRDRPIGERELARCVAIGHVFQLALANALTHERSEREAMTDPLTMLANRRGLDELFRARRGRRPFGVLSLDLDGLKAVNDRHGHGAGDKLIVCVANAIRRSLRDGDVLARIGGDEFAAVVFDADDEALESTADRVLRTLRTESSDSTRARVSIGGACADAGSAPTLGTVLRRADLAMYEAKRSGGMCYASASELTTQAA